MDVASGAFIVALADAVFYRRAIGEWVCVGTGEIVILRVVDSHDFCYGYCYSTGPAAENAPRARRA